VICFDDTKSLNLNDGLAKESYGWLLKFTLVVLY